jgi:hypothetical protein
MKCPVFGAECEGERCGGPYGRCEESEERSLIEQGAITEREECLRIVRNRIKLATMCGCNSDYLDMIEKAIERRGAR